MPMSFSMSSCVTPELKFEIVEWHISADQLRALQSDNWPWSCRYDIMKDLLGCRSLEKSQHLSSCAADWEADLREHQSCGYTLARHRTSISRFRKHVLLLRFWGWGLSYPPFLSFTWAINWVGKWRNGNQVLLPWPLLWAKGWDEEGKSRGLGRSSVGIEVSITICPFPSSPQVLVMGVCIFSVSHVRPFSLWRVAVRARRKNSLFPAVK